MNLYSSIEGMIWVVTTGEKCENMTLRLGDLLTTKIDLKNPSEVDRGLNDGDRSLRMMDDDEVGQGCERRPLEYRGNGQYLKGNKHWMMTIGGWNSAAATAKTEMPSSYQACVGRRVATLYEMKNWRSQCYYSGGK